MADCFCGLWCYIAECDQVVQHDMVAVMQHSEDMFAGVCNAYPGQHVTALSFM